MTEYERIDAKCESLRQGLTELKDACDTEMMVAAMRTINANLAWMAAFVKRKAGIA